jgi:hypothetical protein
VWKRGLARVLDIVCSARLLMLRRRKIEWSVGFKLGHWS